MAALPAARTIHLQRELVVALAGLPAQPDPPAGFIRFDDKTRPALAGTYRGDGLGTLQITALAEGRLSLRIDDGVGRFSLQCQCRVYVRLGSIDRCLVTGVGCGIEGCLRGDDRCIGVGFGEQRGV